MPDFNLTGGVLPSPTFFLKIPEIKGDAVHREHPGEITVRSWSWGENQSVVFKQDAKKSASVTMEDFKFHSISGSASPQLLLYCASGKILKSATLTCIKPKGSDSFTYLTIELSNVIITEYHIAGDDGAHLPAEDFSLSFKKIEMKVSAEKNEGGPGGAFTCSWDLSTDK